MNGQDLMEKLALIDPQYIAQAEQAPARHRRPALWAAAAAAAVLAAVGLWATWPRPAPPALPDMGRPYRQDTGFVVENTAPVWPWAERTPAEQYTTLTFNGRTYRTYGRPVIPDRAIGRGTVTGYDDYTEQTHRQEAAVYALQGADPRLTAAVKLGEEYIPFLLDGPLPLSTFGEAMDGFGLRENLPLTHFETETGDTVCGHYALSDGTAVWQLLEGCRQAPLTVTDEKRQKNGVKSLTFSATAPRLGAYKLTLTVREDGYLFTNLWHSGIRAAIGRDAAAAIIAYATENAAQVPAQPYMPYIVGTVTKIADGRLYLDDTALCQDPADGRIFAISTAPLPIRRLLDHGYIRVGDTVQVTYTGSLPTADTGEITGVESLEKGTLTGNVQIEIPE